MQSIQLDKKKQATCLESLRSCSVSLPFISSNFLKACKLYKRWSRWYIIQTHTQKYKIHVCVYKIQKKVNYEQQHYTSVSRRIVYIKHLIRIYFKCIYKFINLVIITLPPLELSDRSTRHQETHTCTVKDEKTNVKLHWTGFCYRKLQKKKHLTVDLRQFCHTWCETYWGEELVSEVCVFCQDICCQVKVLRERLNPAEILMPF